MIPAARTHRTCRFRCGDRESTVKLWICRGLMPLFLIPVAIPIGATETLQSDEPPAAESRTVEETKSEEGGAQGSAADEGTQRASGGIFSAIVEFFRGAAPEPLPEEGRDAQSNTQAGPEPDDAREREPQAGPLPASEPEEGQSPDEAELQERTPPPKHANQQEPGPIPPAGGEEAEDGVSADHVYRATLDLLREIEVLREAQGVGDDPGAPETRADRTLLHTYIESREVMEKTARVQRRLGMIPVEVSPVPVKEITPRDLHRNVRAIMEEVRRVKRQLVVRTEIQSAPLSEDVSPALTHRNLEYASSLLDGLVGRATTSNDVYMHVLRVHDEMTLIGAHLGVTLESEPPAVEGNKEPREVAEQVLRAVYKAVNLQFRLGMDASNLPNVELEDVMPADVFDAFNILMGELMRIKVYMGIQSLPAEPRHSQRKRSSDTFAEVLLVLENLEAITKAAHDAQ